MDKADIVIIGSGVGGSTVIQTQYSYNPVTKLKINGRMPKASNSGLASITMLEVIRSFTGPQCFAFVKVILMPRK